MTSTHHPEDPDGRENPDDLMTAGRFGSLTLLSPKALRIYADRELLVPYLVDPANGYRYYTPDQVRAGWLIRLLRSAGLSLEEIGQIIRVGPPREIWHNAPSDPEPLRLTISWPYATPPA
jgi:DNA-binding transcriptional MerR regulator